MDILNTGLHTTSGKLYFLTVDTRERLEIQFVPPEIRRDRSADMASIHIVGRNTPRYQHVGGETLLNLSLDFYADEESIQSVRAKAMWLESLTYNDANKKPAQRVILVFGDLFKKEVWVVKSTSVTYRQFDKPKGFMPRQALVDIKLGLDTDSNWGWDDVRGVYSPGTADGNKPIDLGKARLDDSDDEWLDVTNSNTFQDIINRALQRNRVGVASALNRPQDFKRII